MARGAKRRRAERGEDGRHERGHGLERGHKAAAREPGAGEDAESAEKDARAAPDREGAASEAEKAVEKAVEALDERVYADIDGYKVAAAVKRELREQKRFEETVALTYGEVRCSAFADLLREAGISSDQEPFFADIGSGTGKAVLTAALCGFGECLGIEIVEKLHACAERGLERAREEGLVAEDANVRFVAGDSFTLADQWTKADVVFAPTTCFTEELMAKLTAQLEALKSGARIITTTRTLESKLVKLVLRKRFRYARGSLEFLVWERLPNRPVRPAGA